MLLCFEPLDSVHDLRLVAFFQTSLAAHIQQSDGNEPPECRVDAAQVPEICGVVLGVDELGDLTVPGLELNESFQTSRCGELQLSIARQFHADGANRSVTTKDRRVAALASARSGRGRENAGRRKILSQQRNGSSPTLGNQITV